jgi:hypothetical protein
MGMQRKVTVSDEVICQFKPRNRCRCFFHTHCIGFTFPIQRSGKFNRHRSDGNDARFINPVLRHGLMCGRITKYWCSGWTYVIRPDVHGVKAIFLFHLDFGYGEVVAIFNNKIPLVDTAYFSFGLSDEINYYYIINGSNGDGLLFANLEFALFILTGNKCVNAVNKRFFKNSSFRLSSLLKNVINMYSRKFCTIYAYNFYSFSCPPTSINVQCGNTQEISIIGNPEDMYAKYAYEISDLRSECFDTELSIIFGRSLNDFELFYETYDKYKKRTP